MAKCVVCGSGGTVMHCICALCRERMRWHPADQVPKLEEQRDLDPAEGEYIFYASAPLLLWRPDKEPHQVVGRYLQDECWAGFADRYGVPVQATHWMEWPEAPKG